MRTIPSSSQFRITTPCCPACNSPYRVRIIAIAPGADGRYLADEIYTICEGRVPANEVDQERWHAAHLVHENTIRTQRASILGWLNAQIGRAHV